MNPLYLDIETSGLDPFQEQVALVQVMNNQGKTLLIQNVDDAAKLKPVLENNLIVGQNLKFDIKFLKHHYNIDIRNVFDTYLAELVLSGGLKAGKGGASIKDLTKKYLDMDLDKVQQTSFKKGQNLSEAQKQYAAKDVEVLKPIYEKQLQQIKEKGLEKIINIEMGCIPAVVWLELSGIYFDEDYNQQLKEKTLSEKREIEKQIAEYLRETESCSQMNLDNETSLEINLNSPQQIQTALIKLGLKVSSTSESNLKQLDHPVTDLILDYREKEKLLNTFIEKVPKSINPNTCRIHSNFNQFGAHSSRFTSSNPNMQQQPSSQDWRDVYRAELGNKIITADYSQIELRILAQVSQDEKLIQAYNNNVDLHTLTASKVFNVNMDDVSKEQRSMAKSVNFGVVYGMGPKGLKSNLKNSGVDISEREAEKMINNFYEAYPGVSQYLQKKRKQAMKNYYVKNAAGRILKFNKPDNKKKEGYIQRQAQNLPIQSLCADMVKIALSNIYEKLGNDEVKFINTVHDEIVFEAPENKTEKLSEIVKSEMEKAGKYYLKDVPCISEVSVSDTWQKD